jgi:regulator of RNase E activity RraA
MAIADIPDFRRRLLQLDSCVVSDALDRLKLTGAVTGLNRLSTDEKLAGPVLTVRLEAANGRTAERHLGTAAVEAAHPGDVIVIEHKSRGDCAGWGGLLTYAAKARGVGGAVIDGLCRDIDESRRLAFPVFGRGVTPVTARGRIVETAFNAPVTIGSVAVEPGDWVLADGSGVVFLAAPHAVRILEEAEGLVRREAALIAQIDQGVPVSQVMAGTYEHMLRKES